MLSVRCRCIPIIAANPVKRDVQSGSDSLGGKRKVNCASEFVRNKIADYASTIARFPWSFDPWPAGFLPYENKLRAPVQLAVPPHRYVTRLGGKRSVLGGVGHQLRRLGTPFYGAAARLRFHAAKTPSRPSGRVAFAAQQLHVRVSGALIF